MLIIKIISRDECHNYILFVSVSVIGFVSLSFYDAVRIVLRFGLYFVLFSFDIFPSEVYNLYQQQQNWDDIDDDDDNQDVNYDSDVDDEQEEEDHKTLTELE